MAAASYKSTRRILLYQPFPNSSSSPMLYYIWSLSYFLTRRILPDVLMSDTIDHNEEMEEDDDHNNGKYNEDDDVDDNVLKERSTQTTWSLIFTWPKI